MEYKLGKDRRIIEQGQTVEIECPNCKSKVPFSVFTNKDLTLKAQMPLFQIKEVFFLVCPKCASLYGVDETKGKEFKKGEKLAIGNYDLKELKQFNI